MKLKNDTMKIGILTYHRSHNYGALLQAFSLKTFLRESGNDVGMIDYWPDYHAHDYALIPYFRFLGPITKLKAIILFIIGYPRILKRSLKYRHFIRDQFNLGNKVMFSDSSALNTLVYDVVIYGSDQIWRNQNYPFFKGFDEVYFGIKMPDVKRKIAYAASMGVMNIMSEADSLFIKRMMNNFYAISVRESELKKTLEDICKYNIHLVLDPIFLLDKQKWISFIPPRKIHRKYILLYQLVLSEDSVKLTDKLQQLFGYSVIEIQGRVDPLLFGNRYRQTESPFEFLSLLYYAEFIVSTSFHGAAFAIIFEKQFYAIGMGNNSSRIKTLLSSLGLENRYLLSSKDADSKESIDYTKIYNRLKITRDASIRFLNNAIYAKSIGVSE